MLRLQKIVKDYTSGDAVVHALKGIDLSFRRSEFVSILGPSGCGKTTLLNIIGGLDRYTSGDLSIDGVSTKQYRDGDWDSYRNHSIGFVFQNYNLIPHQSVLSNVELALTLSGVPKAERRRRATEALQKVGLGDQLKKRPNQMSGGQMQRVAIARALVNDPEILLADEPTGALDTATSVQIMELLREISRDRLIIMVTHNPELAEKYSTRIIRLLDGEVVDDSNPCTEREIAAPKKAVHAKKTSMSFLTALSLSRNNLMTKKTRTFLTAFAGSIGIIGIALILSLSHGIQTYINRVQEDTLSSYPITLESEVQDYSALMSAMTDTSGTIEGEREENRIYVDDSMGGMMAAMNSTRKNNLADFYTYLKAHEEELDGALNAVQYTYDFDMMAYSGDGKTQINPTTIFDNMGEQFSSMMSLMQTSAAYASSMSMFNCFQEMIDNDRLLREQYDVVAGEWAQTSHEVMLVVDSSNTITNMSLYMLGLADQGELEGIMNRLMKDGEYETSYDSYSYDELLGMTFYLVPNTAFYVQTGETYTVDGTEYPVWHDVREDSDYVQQDFVREHGVAVTVTAIIRPAEGAVATALRSGSIAYHSALTEELMHTMASDTIAKQQMATQEYNVLTGYPFERKGYSQADIGEFLSDLDENAKTMIATMLSSQAGTSVTVEMLPSVLAMLDEATFAKLTEYFIPSTDATYESNLRLLGVTRQDTPASISLYARDFASKDTIVQFISDYNAGVAEEDQITYTDMVGLMMSSITMIINVISYVLIAFVSISLVVSSIMIGIITYISVLERTKEIGVLRSIGASKRDISRVFNAETLIVGFTSGAIGIGITLLLCFPINALIRTLSGIPNIGAALPWQGGIILVLISMALTLIAGLIPSRLAAKKDPVVALRSE